MNHFFGTFTIMNAILQNYKAKFIQIKNCDHSNINSAVQQIYVINLAEDTAKRNYIITLFRKLKINFSLVVVDRISSENFEIVQQHSKISASEAGCLFSHLWCLQHIIQHQLSNAIVFEDDIFLHKNFETLLLKQLERKPDFLTLGACDFSFRKMNFQAVSDNVYFPLTFEYVFGAHANYYSLEGAKRMFEVKTSCFSFFDNFYAEIFCFFPNSSGICYPPLAIADISSSNLDHSYGLLSVEETSYFYKCYINLNFLDYHIIYVHLLDMILDPNEVFNFTCYEELIQHVLLEFFDHNEDETKQVLNRLSFDFFQLSDVRAILFKG